MVLKKEVNWDDFKRLWPEKFAAEDRIFQRIHPGARIFVGTACSEPGYLVRAFLNYIEANPGAILDSELIHVWDLGAASYSEERFRESLRLNSFFMGEGTRSAVNSASADYTPAFLSEVPGLFYREIVPIDIAFIQTSPPNDDGSMSLGINVDIEKAAISKASLVVAQANSNMPRVHGDGMINIDDVDFMIPKDEPLLEYDNNKTPDDIAQRIGRHAARIVEDGATIQVGYGSIPNAVLSGLENKKHLGLHSELFSDGVADLMKSGAIDNTQKSMDHGKAVASFCMGRKETYDYLDENPSVEFKTIDYTNNIRNIIGQRNMTAINSALEIDLTGQATSESLGGMFYMGVGGQIDFIRGAAIAPGGKSILALPSTSEDGSISRIVPQLSQGTSATLHRGDVRYVVTEYGIAYLHGKSIRERAMDLVAIAHPRFRPWLISEAKRLSLIYRDQEYIPIAYPEALEACRITKTGLKIILRPVKIDDEPLLKEFFYSLSDRSMYMRFASARKDMSHQRLQEFVAIDYSRVLIVLAIVAHEEKETVVGVAQYSVNEDMHTAEFAFVVRDDYQNKGVGRELHSYMKQLARRKGLLGFTAEVLEDNMPAFNLLKRMGYEVAALEGGTYDMKLRFD